MKQRGVLIDDTGEVSGCVVKGLLRTLSLPSVVYLALLTDLSFSVLYLVLLN